MSRPLRTEVSDPFAARPPLSSIHGIGATLYLDGYFQDPTWYDASVQSVAGMIASGAPPWVVANQHSTAVPDLVVHLRRTDYERIGWALPLGYYRRALNALALPAGASFMVVSDDRELADLMAAALIARGLERANMDVLRDDGSSALFDFWVLALAKNVVIANSTFSWWAAQVGRVLAGGAAHAVVAPWPWLPAPAVFRGYPDDWLKIDSGFGESVGRLSRW